VTAHEKSTKKMTGGKISIVFDSLLKSIVLMFSAFFLNFDAASNFEEEGEAAETVESEGKEEEEEAKEESSCQEREVG